MHNPSLCITRYSRSIHTYIILFIADKPPSSNYIVTSHIHSRVTVVHIQPLIEPHAILGTHISHAHNVHFVHIIHNIIDKLLTLSIFSFLIFAKRFNLNHYNANRRDITDDQRVVLKSCNNIARHRLSFLR